MVNSSHFIDLTLSENEDDSQHTRTSGSVQEDQDRVSSHDPPTYIPKRGRVCFACEDDAELSTRCDGECPCSWCAERGMSCLYPGNIKPVTLNVSLRPQHRPRTPLAARSSSPAFISPEGRHTSALHLNISPTKSQLSNSHNFVAGKDEFGANQGPGSHLRIDDEPFNEESDSDDGPPLALNSIEQVTRLLKRHEARLRVHQEYLLRPILSRAKLEAIKTPRLDVTSDQRNPFAKLIQASRTGPILNQKSSSLSLLVKTHKTGAPKKWTTVTVPLVIVRTSPTILPKYKSIGRLGSSLLAQNSGVLKYLPYFADVEKFPEADKKRVQEIEDYYHTDEHRMRNQRTCFELAELWKPWVEQFVSDLGIQFKDIMWHMLDDMDHDKECKRCKTNLQSMTEIRTLYRNRPPSVQDSRSLIRARLATAAFETVAAFSIWHVILETEFVKQATELAERQNYEANTLCSICFLHNCMVHGMYAEPEDMNSGTVVFSDGNNQAQSTVKINDDERHLNERLMVVVPNKRAVTTHQCGLYCVDTETSIKAILGRKQGGGADGVYNRGINATRPGLENHEVCGAECFWQIERRIQFSRVSQTKSFQPDINPEQRNLFKMLLKFHSHNQRAPCMIAADIDGLTCLDAFYYILAAIQWPSHVVQTRLHIDSQGTRKLSKAAQGLDTSESGNLDQRPPFIPCSHEGLCQNNPDCSCSEDHVHCEQFCGCDMSCRRRYQGCSCAGSNKVCFDDNRCECWTLNRECDPWLCGTCGAMEVLDPANKYNDEIRKGRCRNTKIQLELPARTIKAPSEVQGWGLFAGQDLEKNAFIGEYKGERVGNQESDRRGTVYHHLGQEYLFTVNREQQIDGSNFGNKMRFINNSMREEYINVQAKNLLCNGVQRIMLYAKCALKAGDELLYNYNYPEPCTKDSGNVEKDLIPEELPSLRSHWPMPEWPRKVGQPSEEGSSGPRTTLKQPAVRRDGIPIVSERHPDKRFILKVQPHEGRDVKREAKRKRLSDGDLPPAYATAVRENDVIRDDEDASEFEGALVTTSTDEDEHLLGGAEAESSSHEEAHLPALNRQRRIGAQDKRLGGYAQKVAWETRKKKLV